MRAFQLYKKFTVGKMFVSMFSIRKGNKIFSRTLVSLAKYARGLKKKKKISEKDGVCEENNWCIVFQMRGRDNFVYVSLVAKPLGKG